MDARLRTIVRVEIHVRVDIHIRVDIHAWHFGMCQLYPMRSAALPGL
jgi:hypothetical protein